ncbi:hypothetical protein KAH37_06515, partial [bacterium]|nr:hypothetical protein [bacterium]
IMRNIIQLLLDGRGHAQSMTPCQMLVAILFLFLLSCSGCNSNPPIDSDVDSDKRVDTDITDSDISSDTAVDADDDITCPPYPSECELAETTLCRSGSLYQCVQELRDGCPVAHSYRLIESCKAGCEVETEPSSGVAGVAKCGEAPDDGCPPLEEVSFPLQDKEGNLSFCRECDNPTAADSQCVANLWRESNERLCVEKPEYDCCGYPCEMSNLKPMTKKWMEENRPNAAEAGFVADRCDILMNQVNPKGWTLGAGTFKHFNISEGKIGFYGWNVIDDGTRYRSNEKYFEYDLQTGKYKAFAGNVIERMAYNKGVFFGLLLNLDKNVVDGYRYPIFIDNKGNRKVVYPEKIRDLPYTPALTDKWVFTNLTKVKGGSTELVYAKVGTWKWRSLGVGIAYKPNIVGDKVAFYMDNFKGYVCDFAKTPTSLSQCVEINRESEEVRYPTIDQQNNNLIYYTPVGLTNGVIKVDMTKTPIEYSEINFTVSAEDLLSTGVKEVNSNLLIFSHIWGKNYEDAKRIICYYRLDTQKSFCALPVPWEYEGKTGETYEMGYSDFEGHTLAWQHPSGGIITVRDMECYCDWNAELCPFDDYTPNTEHPKRDGFRDERCEDKTKCDYTDILK